MTTAAMDDARREGALFASTFVATRKFNWPNPAGPDLEQLPGYPRTMGAWQTGTFTPAVRAAMSAIFMTALDADPTPAKWLDNGVKTAWREAAIGEFDRRLTEVARFAAPTGVSV